MPDRLPEVAARRRLLTIRIRGVVGHQDREALPLWPEEIPSIKRHRAARPGWRFVVREPAGWGVRRLPTADVEILELQTALRVAGPVPPVDLAATFDWHADQRALVEAAALAARWSLVATFPYQAETNTRNPWTRTITAGEATGDALYSVEVDTYRRPFAYRYARMGAFRIRPPSATTVVRWIDDSYKVVPS